MPIIIPIPPSPTIIPVELPAPPQGSYLTPQQAQTTLQGTTLTVLGIDPATDTKAYSKVRIDWPTGGAPGWMITDDICFVSAVSSDNEEDVWFESLREVKQLTNDPPDTVTVRTTYTRVWKFGWTFYGPNSYDNARKVRSAMFGQVTHDLFANSNLYLVTATNPPKRAPELFQGQWWERVDWSARFNEAVIENETFWTVASVEVKVYDQDSLSIYGPVRDITVTR